MAPTIALKAAFLDRRALQTAKLAVAAAGPAIAKRSHENLVLRRGLTVDHTQAITLGIIAVYVVVIALLWNLPYIRWSLWPFKVSAEEHTISVLVAKESVNIDARHCVP